MKIREVLEYFRDKDDIETPLADELILAGYKQKSGGYIKLAKEREIKNPTQYWHLMNAWEKKDYCKNFTKRVQCGELLFWMSEVSQALSKEELIRLKDEVLKIYTQSEKRGVSSRRKLNKKIRDATFDKIVISIENDIIK